jgi:periplasmic divalent cation tolerance protein
MRVSATATATPQSGFERAAAAVRGIREAWRETDPLYNVFGRSHPGHYMSDYVIVLTTLPADADGSAIAEALVEARVAACVNLLPVMESVYRWQETIERDSERQMVIKTSRPKVGALWERLRELHPYEVPEFVVLPIVDGSEAYLQWIGESTR